MALVERIISGGQTGADEGGLEAGLALGLPIGGWCPKGRRREGGPVPAKYPLREAASPDYKPRTLLNVRDSDCTVVFVESVEALEQRSPGSRLTIDACFRLGKACLLFTLDEGDDATIARHVRQRLKHSDAANAPVRVLNVAGQRESSCPGIRDRVKAILVEALA